jgi:hypothetical protein
MSGAATRRARQAQCEIRRVQEASMRVCGAAVSKAIMAMTRFEMRIVGGCNVQMRGKANGEIRNFAVQAEHFTIISRRFC